MITKRDVEQVAAQHPDLGQHGYKRGDRAFDIKRVIWCANYLGTHFIPLNGSGQVGSYGLKHHLEDVRQTLRAPGDAYVPNGEAVLAAAVAGFNVKPYPPNPNYSIGIDLRIAEHLVTASSAWRNK